MLLRHTANVSQGYFINGNSMGFPMMYRSKLKTEFSILHVFKGVFRKTMKTALFFPPF